MKEINEDQVISYCLKKQHLTEDTRINNIMKITEDIGGLHATSSTTPYLSLFARTKNFQREYLDNELYRKRHLGKVRYVRATIYVLPKEMIPIAFCSGRSTIKSYAEKYTEYHGISKKEYQRTSKQILDILKGKNKTLKEIKDALNINTKIAQIVNLLCDSGQLIRGLPKAGWKSNLHTYHRMDDYFPGLDLFSFKEKEAKKRLIRRYIDSFGPVTLDDISWWTKFTKTEIRRIMKELEDQVTLNEISDFKDPHFILTSQSKFLQSTKIGKEHTINLLPTLDPFVMGYKERERYLDLDYYEYVFDRSGNGVSSILVDGKIIGIWDFAEKPKPTVKLFFFESLKKDAKGKILLKAKNIGKFISQGEVQIKECKDMIPLPKRTAGAIMAPLKDC